MPRQPGTLADLIPPRPEGRVNLDVLGPAPSAMETVGMLAPMVGGTIMAPSLPAALLGIPAYHALANGALPEPFATVAELLLGAMGKGASGEALAAAKGPQWRPGMPLGEIEGIAVPRMDPKKLLVEDVARYVQGQVQKHLGAVDDGAAPKTKMRRLMHLGRKEMEDQMGQPETGLDWYDKDIQLADDMLAKVFPELGTDRSKNIIWKAISSILSPASNPQEEAFSASRVWEQYRDTGELPIKQPSGMNWPSQGAEPAMTKFRGMLSELGEDGLAEFLTSPQTVAEIRRFRPGAEGKAADTTYGAVALGPKVGRYLLNKLGIREGGSTVDLWDTRNKHRQLGYMFDRKGDLIEAPLRESDRSIFMDAHAKLGDEFGLTPQQAQSAQWHYEQSLYRALGMPVKSYKTSDGVKKYLQLRELLPPGR